MMRSHPIVLAALALSGAVAGCGCNPELVGSSDGNRYDLSLGGPDLAFPPGTDLWGIDFSQQTNACGTTEPNCQTTKLGPPMKPFPLQSDPQPDPNQTDNGVDRDQNGWIGLSSAKSNFDFLWLANYTDWNLGTVSKLNSKTVKEAARYTSVTCFSNPKGSRAACDGTNGCCSRDDFASYGRRLQMMPSGPHQAVQTANNHPSRTAVDYNGDVWVANRAFGGQASVTKIANSPADCVDRNGAPGLQTSSDVNGDGVIDTDCNRNGVADDVADVKTTPCQNGKPQEFYGLDDECLLFTTNVNSNDKVGRPLALGRGSVDFGPSDAWPGTYNDGMFFRIDGATGLTKAQAKVNGNPYGATVDSAGILWAPNLGSGLNFFDTQNPQMVGTARNPGFSSGYYGITLDRDQNLWMGGWPPGSGNAYRYTPDRSNGFAKLHLGWWTVVTNPGGGSGAAGNGRGIAADSRSMGAYFVWMARDSGWISRINASAIGPPMGQDRTVDGTGMPAMRVAGGSTIGAGVDTDQNIWGISLSGSVATRIKVDQNGNMAQPDIGGGMNDRGCPVGAGDRCTLALIGTNSNPQPYTYSDFTGFGLRNFTNPKGFYAYVQRGCVQGDTRWLKVSWDSEAPPNTKITMRARSGKTNPPDNTWGPWTGDYPASPSDLKGPPGPLMPNPNPYLQVEFDLSTMDKAATPKLKSFEIVFECAGGIG